MASESVTSQSRRKRVPIAVSQRATKLVIAVLILFAGSIFFQTQIDPTRRQLDSADQNNVQAMGGLNNEFLLLPLLGFREAAAGLLWVRCDEFFDSGDYDAILPLVRVITWLDPHADNVYVTGAWHLAYNFTDSQERSDRRYIAPSEALLNEGIRNNPLIPDIKFEKGWENYDKIKDYPTAADAFIDAIDTKPNPASDDYPYGAPLKTLHILAHTYEREGRIPLALMWWQKAIERSQATLKRSHNNFDDVMMYHAEQRNYKENWQRYYDRYTTVKHDQVNTSRYPGVEWPYAGGSGPGPWDVSFHPKIVVKRPKVIDISGLFNAADGARVDVLIEDWDYQAHPPTTATAFAVDPSQTILIDSIAVRKNYFEREIDMSKDPKMYSFSQSWYRIVLSYNPRTTAPHLLDRFGWNGEGITDDNPAHVFIASDPGHMGTRFMNDPAGQGEVWDGKTVPWEQFGQPDRMIKVTYKVSRSQLMGQEPITDANIVPNTSASAF